VFNVDKAGPTYLPYNKDEVFEKFTDIEYINFFIYGTKRECDEEEIKYKLSKLNIIVIKLQLIRDLRVQFCTRKILRNKINLIYI